MSLPHRILICAAATLAMIAVPAADVGARGGGGGFRGGGGVRGGGISRGGPAARGSFGYNRAGPGYYRGYNRLGPAADGNFEERRDMRQERREQRQDLREEAWGDPEQDLGDRRENWQEFADEYHDDYGDDYAYDYDTGVVYWELPCRPNVIAMGGETYYTCGTTWYIRAYSEDGAVYTEVPNPTGH